jgi:hypothetical protein
MRNQEISASSPRAIQAETQPTEKQGSALGKKLKSIAKSFSKAGGRLSDLIRPAKKSDQGLAYLRLNVPADVLRTPQATPPGTPRTPRTPVQHPRSGPLAIDETWVMPDKTLSENAQTNLERRIKRLAAKTPGTNNQPVVAISRNKMMNQMLQRAVSRQLPGVVAESETELSLQSAAFIEPKYEAQLVLADGYQKKYDIQILVQKESSKDPAHLANSIMKAVERSQGEPVGVLLKWSERRPMETSNRVTISPILLQQSGNGIDIVNLDNTDHIHGVLLKSARFLQEAGIPVRQLKVHNNGSRALPHTLGTEAMQLLKDALVEHKSVGGNLGERYWNAWGNDDGTHPAGHAYLPYFIDLPPHLQKTAQTSDALQHTRFSPDEALQTRSPSANPSKQQTVGEHRQRFSEQVGDEGQVNHFLTVKSFRNAFKVLDQLQNFSSQSERDNHLGRLEKKHGFD